jgi:hypothetical protein
VWGVVEVNVSFLNPTVNALPGDIFTPFLIGTHLLDFRVLRQRIHVARPTGSDIRDSRYRTTRHRDVTVRTLHLHIVYVFGVDEVDWLHRLATHSEKMANGLPQGCVRRREDFTSNGLIAGLTRLTSKADCEHERKNPYRHSPEQHSPLAQISNLHLCRHSSSSG